MPSLLSPGTIQNVKSIQNDVKVFICGVNVTSLVQSVTTSQSPFDKGGNNCTVTLQNPNDVLTIQVRNLNGEFITRATQPNAASSNSAIPWQQEYDESIKYTVLTSKQHIQTVKTNSGKDLAQVIDDGLRAAERAGKAIYNDNLWTIFPEPGASSVAATRWDLYPGSCVFNTGDPIRVFLRHPDKHIKVGSKYEPVWYHGFTGYLISVTSADNLGDGVFSLVLSAEGAATRMLRLSRITRNYTGYLDVLVQSPELIVGDVVNQIGFTSLLTSMSMPQMLGALVIGGGSSILNQYGPPLDEATTKIQGIGRFSLGTGAGGIQLWESDKFQAWQAAIHPEMTEAQVMEVGGKSGFGPDSEVYSSFGGFSGQYAPDKGSLHILLPNQSFAHFNQIVETAVVSYGSIAESEFDNRLDLITRYICNYLLYTVQETPKGDVLAEFPMYDFTPYDLGDYGKTDLINDSETSTVSMTEDDSKAYTWIVAKGSFTTYKSADDKAGAIKLISRTGHAILANLIPRYGIRVMPIDNPVMRTEEAVKYFLQVACARVVAEIRSAHSTLGLVDPAIISNRPYLLSYKNVLGTLLRINHDIQYQQSTTTSLDLNYIRLVKPLPDGTYKFMLIGGDNAAAKPLSYDGLTTVEDLPGYYSPSNPGSSPQVQPSEGNPPQLLGGHRSSSDPKPTGTTPPPTDEEDSNTPSTRLPLPILYGN